MAEKITREFVANLGEHYPQVNMTVWSVPLMACFDAYEPALATAQALKSGNVDSIATEQWLASDSDSPEAKSYRKLQETIAKLRAKLDETEAEAKSIRDGSIADYVAAAKENVAKNGADAKSALREAKAGLESVLKVALGNVKSLPDDFPKIPGSSSGSGNTGARESGGWRPRLARATVDGVDVPFKGDGPTMADIKVALGLSDGTTTAFSANMRSLNNDNPDVHKDGVTIVRPVNGQDRTIVLYGRPDKEEGK